MSKTAMKKDLKPIRRCILRRLPASFKNNRAFSLDWSEIPYIGHNPERSGRARIVDSNNRVWRMETKFLNAIYGIGFIRKDQILFRNDARLISLLDKTSFFLILSRCLLTVTIEIFMVLAISLDVAPFFIKLQISTSRGVSLE